jgi:hypothetical protein
MDRRLMNPVGVDVILTFVGSFLKSEEEMEDLTIYYLDKDVRVDEDKNQSNKVVTQRFIRLRISFISFSNLVQECGAQPCRSKPAPTACTSPRTCIFPY